MIYIKKILKQDLAKGKQIAFPKEISKDFFDIDVYEELNKVIRLLYQNETIDVKLYSYPKKGESRLTVELQNFLIDRLSVQEGDLIIFNSKGNESYEFNIIYKRNAEYPIYEKILTFYSTTRSSNHLLGLTDSDETSLIESARIKFKKNILYFGVPGCGKSHYVSQRIGTEEFHERVTFHPDYSYGDFVGQILPQKNGENLEYNYVEGPFISILKKAKDDPHNNYFLVIEEINRGNASAIFGDIFQLLDRDESGESLYPITNKDIAEKIYGDGSKKITIPENLYIYATANSNDQNVFVLDTAFKRRWNIEFIENDIENCPWRDTEILDTNVSWGSFITSINSQICLKARDGILDEDKQIGAFFVKDYVLEDSNAFLSKVLMYLWNDVARFDKSALFNENIKCFNDLRKLFIDVNFKDFSTLFTSEIRFKTQEPDLEPTNPTMEESDTEQANSNIEG